MLNDASSEPQHSTQNQSWWRRLSAGLITGAADDDPSGIATYSQVGAKFGYATLWSLFLALPLMIGIQIVSGRIGRVTGKDLGQNLRQHFARPWVYSILALLVIANVINIGADVAAMGAALQLLIGGPAVVYGIGFALLSLGFQVFIPFSRYSPVLKVLTVSLFAYVATVFVEKIPWGQALHGTLIPAFQWNRDYAVAIVAVLGTTISPYLFCWQAAQEVEEIRSSNEREPLSDKPSQAPDALRRINIDTSVGMVFSNVVAFFIVLTGAAVLHAHGKTDIQSSAQAAEALRPVAGRFAFYLFAAGIIGTGLLAIPVLAGATAFAVSGGSGHRYGLEYKPKNARFFYGVLIVSMLLGAALNLTSIDPIKALYWSAVVNGVCAVPMMVMMMLLAQRNSAMGPQVVRGLVAWLGWAATVVMGIAAIVMFLTLGNG
ncbi:NRAMP (natural resistance-associated macrophage protein)-like metal ion transporter [Luteibacter sp. Sphag1AF]|uniref:Nramp family divalent metal transporter n=1 Tax=Luteibacter sp. Sphag1AF TaxID=2587031 RepID=UPI0016177868|nr:Nramp family divalent metal transporter [Luteibacter sp. Sphag1AF]MBB3228111.1 NRAMP (natural resistance-associated macrophage protein)-like metal ion transporter [Luteibacter sp. Sphag1AF]